MAKPGRQPKASDEEIIDMALDGATDGAICAKFGMSARALRERMNDKGLRAVIDQKKAELFAKVAEANMIRRERIVDELAKIITFDLRSIFNDKGEMLQPCDWPPEAGAAIQKLRRNEIRDQNTGEFLGYTVELSIADKAAAAKVINSMLGYVHKDDSAKLEFKAGIVVVPAKDAEKPQALEGGGELMPRAVPAESPKTLSGVFTLRRGNAKE